MQTAAVSALSGIEQSLSRLNAVAERVSAAALGEASSDDTVTLSSDAVSLIQAKDSFAANAAVLKTVDQIQQSIFELSG